MLKICVQWIKTMTRVTAFVRRFDPIVIQAINELGIIIRTKIFEILMKKTYTKFINSTFSTV